MMEIYNTPLNFFLVLYCNDNRTYMGNIHCKAIRIIQIDSDQSNLQFLEKKTIYYKVEVCHELEFERPIHSVKVPT